MQQVLQTANCSSCYNNEVGHTEVLRTLKSAQMPPSERIRLQSPVEKSRGLPRILPTAVSKPPFPHLQLQQTKPASFFLASPGLLLLVTHPLPPPLPHSCITHSNLLEFNLQ